MHAEAAVREVLHTEVKKPVLDIHSSDRFRLDDTFVAKFIGRQPVWGPVGYVTYKRTYARPIWNKEKDGTKTPALPSRLHELAVGNGLDSSEEYWLTLTRLIEGVYTIQRWHCRRLGLPWSKKKAQKSAQEMYQLMWDFKFLPPGRGLWMMGTQYVEKFGGAALNNCAFVSTENIDQEGEFYKPFTFLMDMSMLGVGVGGDTRGAGKVIVQQPVQGDDVHVVPDTREGWVDLVRRVLEAYVGIGSLPASVDYSQVRPEGEPIKGFGGTASGPGPLKRAYAELQRMLNPLIGQPITSSAITDIFNIVGVCVVSGNVRRSAEIMLGDPKDAEFAKLKDPELLNRWSADLDFLSKEVLPISGADGIHHGVDVRKQIALLEQAIENHPLRTHRWASNNSIFATVGMDYTEAAKGTAANGEPGYFWLDTARHYGRLSDPANFDDVKAVGTNPCSEQTLESYELCCLVETFPSKHETYEEYQRTLKYAYLYAKTVTLVPTHNESTNAVMLRNRRIGCSQSGIVQSFKRHGRRTHFQWCDKGYKYLNQLDALYSNWLCVPKSKKRTSVKPSGTVSLLPGVTPGIHYEHAEYYFRTIRIAKTSALIPSLRDAGYRIEDDVYDASSTVVYFPVKAEHFDKGKSDVSMWEQLENAAQMQYYWADNQVSVTVTFKPDEAKDIKSALELYEDRLKSVSFLPLEEHGYVQAPYITITKEEYEAAVANLKPLVLEEVRPEVLDAYCDGDKCVMPTRKK